MRWTECKSGTIETGETIGGLEPRFPMVLRRHSGRIWCIWTVTFLLILDFSQVRSRACKPMHDSTRDSYIIKNVFPFCDNLSFVFLFNFQSNFPPLYLVVHLLLTSMPEKVLDDISHRRFNPLTGSWLLVSPHRTKRPWQ